MRCYREQEEKVRLCRKYAPFGLSVAESRANLECAILPLFRKSRIDVDNPNHHLSQSPAEIPEDGGSLLRRLSECHGLSDVPPVSPSQHSVDLDQGQHMPHLLCSYLPALLQERSTFRVRV
jgi:hypothetical protein